MDVGVTSGRKRQGAESEEALANCSRLLLKEQVKALGKSKDAGR